MQEVIQFTVLKRLMELASIKETSLSFLSPTTLHGRIDIKNYRDMRSGLNQLPQAELMLPEFGWQLGRLESNGLIQV